MIVVKITALLKVNTTRTFDWIHAIANVLRFISFLIRSLLLFDRQSSALVIYATVDEQFGRKPLETDCDRLTVYK
jgi:hypothetical protein